MCFKPSIILRTIGRIAKKNMAQLYEYNYIVASPLANISKQIKLCNVYSCRFLDVKVSFHLLADRPPLSH